MFDRGHLCSFFREISSENKPRGSSGLKKNPEESEDHQNVNPGVSNVEISRGTPGFGVFEEPLGIPNL